jgi:hypothetical protein
VVLDDGGDEAAGFGKIEIHAFLSISEAIKKPAGIRGRRVFRFG